MTLPRRRSRPIQQGAPPLPCHPPVHSKQIRYSLIHGGHRLLQSRARRLRIYPQRSCPPPANRKQAGNPSRRSVARQAAGGRRAEADGVASARVVREPYAADERTQPWRGARLPQPAVCANARAGSGDSSGAPCPRREPNIQDRAEAALTRGSDTAAAAGISSGAWPRSRSTGRTAAGADAPSLASSAVQRRSFLRLTPAAGAYRARKIDHACVGPWPRRPQAPADDALGDAPWPGRDCRDAPPPCAHKASAPVELPARLTLRYAKRRGCSQRDRTARWLGWSIQSAPPRGAGRPARACRWPLGHE